MYLKAAGIVVADGLRLQVACFKSVSVAQTIISEAVVLSPLY